MRRSSGEFAREFPKIAGRLGLDEFACADPYVERLLEGFAFLAARVRLKVDAEFPTFTQSLLETLYPHYLAPMPSMAIAQFGPDVKQKSVDKGFLVPRGTALRSLTGKNEVTPCRYLTAHDVVLRPLVVAEAAYHGRNLAALELPGGIGGKAAIQLSLQCAAGRTFGDLDMDDVVVYLRGGDTATRVYEQLFARCAGLVVRPGGRRPKWHETLARSSVSAVGFSDEEALLPHPPRSFQGYRLLQEYFALPGRFMFVKFSGLAGAVARCATDRLDIIAVMDEAEPELENAVDASLFALHCTPAINLFPHRADRANITDRDSEVHVVPDRTRPLDFEVYRVTRVVGYGTGAGNERPFLPFYSSGDAGAGEANAYYVTRRAPRAASARVRERGPRSSYTGSDVFLSLVDPESPPYAEDLRQLSVEVLCTNRDLPLQMPVGQGKTDFLLEVAAPVTAVKCLKGPTAPMPSCAEGELAWRLVSHLSLNYLSLVGEEEAGGAERLRELLGLYADISGPDMRRQADGVVGMASRSVMRRVATDGPVSFARGLEVALTFDDSCFEGTGVFLMGAVLARFLARFVSINSFTETVVSTLKRGEIMRWPPQVGRRHIL
ncbi:MAG: type VI secretion system baseplate subunit TssF [Planctomycetota bacterium]